MIFEPKTFYQDYQKDYHRIKATYLKGMIDNLKKCSVDFFEQEFTEEEERYFNYALKSDLRQTYFHAIETFFELFFALDPRGQNQVDDRYLLFKLTYSNWKETYNKINAIAKDAKCLDFLNEEIAILSRNTTIGKHLFYTNFFPSESIPSEVFNKIESSIEAIKEIIRILAFDFVNREEYNAYKHGLRLIPTAKKIILQDIKTRNIKMEWDLSESMSFYLKSKSSDEMKVVTKLFDSERDFKMTYLCSSLIHHLIFYRRISLRFPKDRTVNKEIKIEFFDKDLVKESSKINVKVQDLVYTVTRIKD